MGVYHPCGAMLVEEADGIGIYTKSGHLRVALDSPGSGVYDSTGARRMTDTTGQPGFVGKYAKDGSWNVTIVDGSQRTGLFAPNGSINIVLLNSFDPSILFANGEQGAWYDPSDLSTVFQDANGTIPSLPGDPVGLVLDPRLWEGRTLAQELAAQAELVPNGGGPFVNTTGWTASGSASVGVVDGWLRLTAPDGPPVFAGTVVPTVAGRLYRISSQWRSSGTATSRVIVGTSIGNNNLLSALGANSGDIAGYFTAVGATTWVSLRSLVRWEAGSWAEIPLVTVKEIPGNHLSQTTAAARPTLMQDGENYYIQPDLTDDALTTTFPATIAGDILIAGRNGSIIEPFSGNTLTIGPTSYTGGTPGILSAIGGIVGVVLIDRSLTQLEQDNLVAYYMARGAGDLL